MDKGHVVHRKSLAYKLISLVEAAQVKFLVLLDERVDDIRLSAHAQLGAQGLVDVHAVLLVAQNRRHRLAARRKLVDDRYVQVAVDRHRQRARDGRCRHHQHMGWDHVLAPKAGALGNAEPVLLVDDRQPQVAELHGILYQGVCAHQQLYAAVLQAGVDLAPLTGTRAAREQAHVDAYLGDKLAQGVKMLARQDLRGRHHARLVAVVDSQEHAHQRHQGLAAANVALDKAVHLAAGGQVGVHLADDPFLGARQGKG